MRNGKINVAIIGECYIGTGKGLCPIELFKSIRKIDSKYNFKLYLRDTAPFHGSDVVKIKTFKTKIRLLNGLGYYIPLFFKLFKDKSIDIIHAYDEKTNIVANILGKPHVVTGYDLDPIHFKFPFNYIFRKIYRHLNKAKSILVVSDYAGEMISKEFPDLSKKIITIHLGTDINRFKPTTKKRRIYLNIGILGNLDKKLWNVFDKILKEYGGKVKIVLGGYLPKEFNYLKSHQGVIYKGRIEESDLVKHYQDIDIFVYKINADGATFELIPLEAMASGCAVVVSNVGALPKEVIKNGGLLVENSEKSFYEGIKKMIDNKKLRQEYQKKGRKQAKELTWDKHAEKHLEIYDKIKLSTNPNF